MRARDTEECKDTGKSQSMQYKREPKAITLSGRGQVSGDAITDQDIPRYGRRTKENRMLPNCKTHRTLSTYGGRAGRAWSEGRIRTLRWT